jgi:Putative abortive phage resistance protein AbiGi, antitoxin
MSVTYESIIAPRSDPSFFLVHLTKTKNDLKSILTLDSESKCTLEARKPMGKFAGTSDEVLGENIKAVCFTESPLAQLRHIIEIYENAEERKHGKFGVVFDRNFLIKKGANPCFYLNSYIPEGANNAVFEILKFLQENGRDFDSEIWKFFGLFNIFGTSRDGEFVDYYWEREWRYFGDFKFKHEDICVALCPEKHFEFFENNFQDVIFVDPTWHLDAIVKKVMLR